MEEFIGHVDTGEEEGEVAPFLVRLEVLAEKVEDLQVQASRAGKKIDLEGLSAQGVE